MKVKCVKSGKIIEVLEISNNFRYLVKTDKFSFPFVCPLKMKVGETIAFTFEVKHYEKIDGLEHWNNSTYILKKIKGNNSETTDINDIVFEINTKWIVLNKLFVTRFNSYEIRKYGEEEILYPFDICCDLKRGYYEEVKILREVIAEYSEGFLLYDKTKDYIYTKNKRPLLRNQYKNYEKQIKEIEELKEEREK